MWKSLLWVLMLLVATSSGCQRRKRWGPPVPASSDPQAKDLVEGAVVVAHEKTTGGVRIYKIKTVVYFPPPMTDELVMLAFKETGNDFRHASDLWGQRKLTVALANVRVHRKNFRKRDYRVLAIEKVSKADLALKHGDKFGPKPASKPR